jgi:hypothetical protein
MCSRRLSRSFPERPTAWTKWLNFGLRGKPKIRYKPIGSSAPRGNAMLYGLSKQISHCYFRAAECREYAAGCVSPTDRQFYSEREQAWLTLARSYEFQERVNRMVTELRRNAWCGGLPPGQSFWVKPPQCPACAIQMQFQASGPVKPMFAEAVVSFERALFVCTNCRRLGDQLAAMASD